MEWQNRSPQNEEALSKLSKRVGNALLRQGKIAALAESCTGGLVGHLLTDIPGSSSWFAGGAVVYSYEAKERLLGVDRETLMRKGAVCVDVARQMAQGAVRLFETDVAVAITGIAGPDGGSDEKPVGLVHFCLSTAGRAERNEHLVWQSDRRGNKLLSAEYAMQMLLDYAQNKG